MKKVPIFLSNSTGTPEFFSVACTSRVIENLSKVEQAKRHSSGPLTFFFTK
jgi:hypothetical protein